MGTPGRLVSPRLGDIFHLRSTKIAQAQARRQVALTFSVGYFSRRSSGALFSPVPPAVGKTGACLGLAGPGGYGEGGEVGLRSSVSYTHLRAHETVLDLVC